MYWEKISILLITGALLFCGCAGSPDGSPSQESPSSPCSQSEESASAEDEIIKFNGISKKKSELSEDTQKWLNWYYTLADEERDSLSFIPSEFIVYGSNYTVETDQSQDAPAYAASLTDEELAATEELARYYFTEKSPGFGGVEEILPAEDDFPMYKNTGIESEYPPGNIIIYLVLTGKDKSAGNPMRSISIARKSKSDNWKVINSGY